MAGRYISVNQAIARSRMAEEILKTLQNPEELTQLQIKGRKLASLFEALSQSVTALSEESKIEEHQNTILNSLTQIQSIGKTASSMNENLSRQLQMKKMVLRKKTDSKQINKTIKDIFILEHDILDRMTGGATKTSEYAIYYSSKNKGNNEIYRGTVDAKKLYKSQYVATDKEGNIILKRSIVENQKLMKLWTDEKTKKVNNVAESEHYKNMAKIITAYNVTLQAQYQDLRAIASNIHLGLERDNKLDVLQTMVEGSNELQNFAMEIYQRYRGVANKVNFFSIINRGHLVEAFERFLTLPDDQQMHYESYLDLLKQSLGMILGILKVTLDIHKLNLLFILVLLVKQLH